MTEYAMELFKIHPYDFVVKPFDKNEIENFFKHGNGEGILHVPVLGLVVDGITGQPACIMCLYAVFKVHVCSESEALYE